MTAAGCSRAGPGHGGPLGADSLSRPQAAEGAARALATGLTVLARVGEPPDIGRQATATKPGITRSLTNGRDQPR